MRRKVIKQGHNTLTITLPSTWARKNNISAGDDIVIDDSDNCLVLMTEKEVKSRKAEVNVTKPNRLISRSIFNLYRKGIDEIVVHYDDPIIIKDIYRYLPLLMGFDITYQGKNSTILRNVLKINESEFNNAMRRYMLITKNLAEESFNAIKDGRRDELPGIIELEQVQNRLYMFLSRVINKAAVVKDPTLMYLFVQRVEDIADCYKYVCSYVYDNKIKVSDPVIKMYKGVNQAFELLYNFYFKFDIRTGEQIISMKKKLIVQGLGLLGTCQRKEARVIFNLNRAIISIYEAASPVFGLQR